MNHHPIPLPGREAIIILGAGNTRTRVTVCGRVERTRLSKNGRSLGNVKHTPSMRLVLVQVPGEKRPRRVAVERFVETCADYRL